MNIDNLTINTIRFLCADSVQKANSGHPGLPLGIAPAAYTLFAKHLKHNPKNPDFIDRDRFILSAGHGSSLIYALLNIFDYGITIDDLKNFRQFKSLTPGHPEYKHTKGIEITTGPLGQGIANAVGMAIAENKLAAKFNRDGFKVVDHYTYALCGDGCLNEGVAAEAVSLAGTLGLNKLIILYDSNNITIEGDTSIAFTENVAMRFEAYGFNVLLVEDGNDTTAISNAIEKAKKSDKPTIIEIKTKIGYGSPNKAGKSSAHGEPLGIEEIKLAKKALGFDYDEDFAVPNEVTENMKKTQEGFTLVEQNYNSMFEKYKEAYPDLAKEWNVYFDKNMSVDLLNNEDFWDNSGDLATRVSSEVILNKVAKLVPNIIGGSADLAPSTKTIMKGRGDYSKETPNGDNLHFGIREHAMTAIANGIYVHGGYKVYIAGFFVFSDYMKPAMRLSALMQLPIINIMTHDSIGVGEDGPTHQPIEQLAALRSIPNFTVIRPCDSNETSAAWYLALTRINSPTAIILSRQNLKLLKETGKSAIKGAYILKDSENPDIILIATGSEVELIYEAYDILKSKGKNPRVVSMPSMEVFEEQSDEYKEAVLPKHIRKRLAVEAGSSFGWHKYTGIDGDILAIDTFGASAPANELFVEYGFTVENVVKKALQLF